MPTPPSASNYQIGGVIISLGGVDLGNVAGFGIDASDVEIVQHFTARSGARKVDKQVVVQKRLKFRATLDEHQKTLYARYFMGNTATGDKVLALVAPLAESNITIRYLNESGDIWTFSHTRVTVRPAAAMDFGDFSDFIGYEVEIETLQDDAAPAIDGVVPTHGFFDFAAA